MVAYTLTFERIDWQAASDAGHALPLGRHVGHDSRSLDYLFRPRRAVTIQSVRHAENTPVLDQRALGACTGFAGESATGADPVYSGIPDSVVAKPTGDVPTDEAQAIALYSAATKLDEFRGNYPPDDTGSTGLAAAKAMQAAGLISGYQHATDLNTAVAALMIAPIMIGINWYDSFDKPAADGTISLPRRAQIRGGHELCVVGYEAAGNNGTVNSGDMLYIKNSWNTSWGPIGGYCRMAVGTFSTLLGQQGDATVPVPLSGDPNPPVDPPTPDDVDRKMWEYVQGWAKDKGLV